MDLSPPFDGQCPACGHAFSLADLKRMAVGDGWQRYLRVVMSDGAEAVVSFAEFNPVGMAQPLPVPPVTPRPAILGADGRGYIVGNTGPELIFPRQRWWRRWFGGLKALCRSQRCSDCPNSSEAAARISKQLRDLEHRLPDIIRGEMDRNAKQEARSAARATGNAKDQARSAERATGNEK